MECHEGSGCATVPRATRHPPSAVVTPAWCHIARSILAHTALAVCPNAPKFAPREAGNAAVSSMRLFCCPSSPGSHTAQTNQQRPEHRADGRRTEPQSHGSRRRALPCFAGRQPPCHISAGWRPAAPAALRMVNTLGKAGSQTPQTFHPDHPRPPQPDGPQPREKAHSGLAAQQEYAHRYLRRTAVAAQG